jgi:hypothetical protein
MATLHIEHGITDFSAWKANFDRFAVKRSEAGVKPFFMGVRHLSQIRQTHSQENRIFPECLRCRAAPMSLTCTEEEYPGYKRRMFECLICGDTMTQWAGVPSD